MNNWRVCSWKVIRLGALFVPLSFAPNLGSIPKNDLHPKLAGFYAVDVWDDDYYPYWQSAILYATSQENGVKVQYVYIASATQPCNEPEIKAATVFLPNRKLEQLTNGLDLCLLDASSFNQNVAKYTKRPEAFDTMRSAVVAWCGAEERVFEMPQFRMDKKALKRIEPAAMPMSALSAHLMRKAFPMDKTGDISHLTDIPEGSPQLEELRAGAFDKAFWFAFRGVHPGIPAQVTTSVDPTIGSDSDLGKLRNVLAKYQHPARGNSGRTGTLVDSQGFKLEQYVAPDYSPLAVQTQIEGKVVLSLKVDRVNGKVESVDVVDGHVLLRYSATEAAKQWQFDPSQALPEQIKVVLDFSLHCGN